MAGKEGPHAPPCIIPGPILLMPRAPSTRRSGTFPPDRPVPDDVVRLAADRHHVGRAVAVEVAAAEVLGGDVGVEDGAAPGLAVEVVGGDAVVLAAVAGED